MLYQGLMGAGYCPSPASPSATDEELAGILKISRPKAAVLHPDLVELFMKAAKIAGDYLDIPFVVMDPMSRQTRSVTIYSLQDLERLGKTHPKPLVPLRKHAKYSLALVPFSR